MWSGTNCKIAVRVTDVVCRTNDSLQKLPVRLRVLPVKRVELQRQADEDDRAARAAGVHVQGPVMCFDDGAGHEQLTYPAV